MADDQIKCEICGELTHAIPNHLKAAHAAGSAKPMDLETYKTTYSITKQEQLLSPTAIARIAKAKQDKAEAEAATAAAAAPAGAKPEVAAGTHPDVEMVYFDQAFKFDPSVKAAFTKSGKSIAVMADSRKADEDGYQHLVPEWNENYVLNADLTKTVMMGIVLRQPVFLYGHSGVGKTSIFKQIAAATNRRFNRFQHTVDTEESHIVGQWIVEPHIDEHGKAVSVTKFQLGPLPLAMMHGWLYVADEIDRSSPTVLSAYQAILEGEPLVIKNAPPELRMIKPHPLFTFVATGNTNGTGDQSGLYQATLTQDAATIERFGIVAQVDYPPQEQEIQMIAKATGLNVKDAAKIRQFADEIRTKAFPNQVSLTIGPRVAINIAKIGMVRADFVEGAMYAYCNRLPEAEREAAISIAKRVLA